jgi:hypothetical protein
MLVATLGVVEVECPAIFEKMQPKAKVAMTVRGVWLGCCKPQSGVIFWRYFRSENDFEPC